ALADHRAALPPARRNREQVVPRKLDDRVGIPERLEIASLAQHRCDGRPTNSRNAQQELRIGHLIKDSGLRLLDLAHSPIHLFYSVQSLSELQARSLQSLA